MERIAEIQHCEELLLQAIKGNDINLLDKLLHSDLLFVNPFGQINTKEMDMDNYISGQVMIEHLEASEQIIHLIENTAVVTVKVKLKGKYLENLLDENLQYMRVWMQQEENWKIIGASCVRL